MTKFGVKAHSFMRVNKAIELLAKENVMLSFKKKIPEMAFRYLALI
jgi:hypothetical protein